MIKICSTVLALWPLATLFCACAEATGESQGEGYDTGSHGETASESETEPETDSDPGPDSDVHSDTDSHTDRDAGVDSELDTGNDTGSDPSPFMPIFLLAGQSNMEGNINTDLFNELMAELATGPDDTLQQRLENRLTSWYKTWNDGYALYGYSEQMVAFEASELIRLSKIGLVDADITQPLEDVWCARNDTAVAPLQTNCGNPFGPELILGHYLQSTNHSPTSLIKVVKGGSTLLIDWLSPTSATQSGGSQGEWYTNLKNRIGSLDSDPASVHPECLEQECRFSAFIWFQGENDSFDEENAIAYEQNLKNLISDVRSEIGSLSLPVIVVEIGAWAQSMSFGAMVAAAQQAVVQADPLAELVITDDLSGFYHYDPAAQLIIGERIAKVLTTMLE